MLCGGRGCEQFRAISCRSDCVGCYLFVVGPLECCPTVGCGAVACAIGGRGGASAQSEMVAQMMRQPDCYILALRGGVSVVCSVASFERRVRSRACIGFWRVWMKPHD